MLVLTKDNVVEYVQSRLPFFSKNTNNLAVCIKSPCYKIGKHFSVTYYNYS